MKKMMLKRFYPVVICLSAVMLFGCGNDDTNVTPAPAKANCIVTGRVIDGSTNQPVKDAEVSLFANAVKLTTKSSESEDPELAGTFVFNNVTAAPNSGHKLRITAPGFATMERNVAVAGAVENTLSTTSLGNLAMGKGFALTVIATDKGSPVAGVTISAAEVWAYATIITAVTDASGQAVLTGLNQESEYLITSAPLYDGNGRLKYVSTRIDSTVYNSMSDRVVSLPLMSAGRDDAIKIVASSLLPDGVVNQSYPYNLPNQRAASTDGVITIVFNYPVTMKDTVYATYVNNQVATSDPDYGKVINVPTVSASLDQTGTILTIVNSAPYQKNQTYAFFGSVSAVVNSVNQTFSLNGTTSTSPFFTNSIYIADNTATGLGALTELKADNFNNTTGPSASTTPSPVYLVFPEKVYGSYSVISTQSGTTVTAGSSNAVSFAFDSGAVVHAANTGGADSDVVFRLPLGVNLADNADASASSVTIFINATDAEGNALSRLVTLPVR